jgi:hypothetical protein
MVSHQFSNFASLTSTSRPGTVEGSFDLAHDFTGGESNILNIRRRLLVCLAGAVLILLTLVNSSASARSNPEMRAIRHRQKEERKMLKLQQRAMKRVMAQHGQSSESRKRFDHNLKMQQQLLRKHQKNEIRRLKESRSLRKTPHPSS